MGRAKDLEVKCISSKDAARIVKKLHYSGKAVQNSQIHFGVFLDGKCGGALQFGPSLDKRKLMGLVEGTGWNQFIELNRMALADWLPRNGESRTLSICLRLLKTQYPWLKWVVSFADATQCGDGTIYWAAGFVLTGIKKNDQIWRAPSGEVFCDTSIRPGIGGERERAAAVVFSRASLTGHSCKKQQRLAAAVLSRTTTTKGKHILNSGASSMSAFKDAGWAPLEGFQLRYVYFLDPTWRRRLAVDEIPYGEIAKRGAGMYLGKRRRC